MAVSKKLARPEMPPQKPREPPKYAGDMPKTCANCQHYRPPKRGKKVGECRNGISGRLTTTAINGCAYGFYPSIERFPLKAGPGGSR
jgi:hypothetical protein